MATGTYLVALSSGDRNFKAKVKASDEEEAMSIVEDAIEEGRVHELDLSEDKRPAPIYLDLEVDGVLAGQDSQTNGVDHDDEDRRPRRKGKQRRQPNLKQVVGRAVEIFAVVGVALVKTAAVVTAAHAAYGAFHEAQYHMTRIQSRKPNRQGFMD